MKLLIDGRLMATVLKDTVKPNDINLIIHNDDEQLVSRDTEAQSNTWKLMPTNQLPEMR